VSIDPKRVQQADQIFFARHPERNGKPIQPGEPNFDALAEEWRAIYHSTDVNPPSGNQNPLSTDSAPKEPDYPGGDKKVGEICEECSKQHSDEDKLNKQRELSFRISIFFDGTGNNFFNTTAEQVDKGGSYANDYSNVARLWMRFDNSQKQDFDDWFPIYVEGIGTESGGDDNTYGQATGLGVTGVVSKAEKGLQAVVERITDAANSPEGLKITRVHLDAFGFSRGAAAARYFVWASMENKETKLKTQLEALGYSIGTVKCIFVGLFDTVASYGLDHKDDTEELNLDKLKSAEKVIHLVASEEHRKNFPLTTIKSCASNGEEIYMPGVHSDVGGGYGKIQDESLQLFDIDTIYLTETQKARIKQQREWFISRGWYKDEEIEENFWNEMIGTRNGISNKYSYVALQIMGDLAMKKNIPFVDLPKHYSISDSPELIQLKSEIESRQTIKHWMHTRMDKTMMEIRHRYFHMSACYGEVGMQPYFSNNDKMSGERERLSYDG